MSAFVTLLPESVELLPRGVARLRHATGDGARRELESFLSAVERTAFRMAQIALRHEADALDVVQDTMLQLSLRYASRPSREWKPLFYRILENRIRDVQRRRLVRGRVMAWVPWRAEAGEQTADPIGEAPDPAATPAAQFESDQMLAALEQALEALPRRQRQAFLLRTFEGLDVADTARAMGCSPGSVKTHYFRAVQGLRAKLEEYQR